MFLTWLDRFFHISQRGSTISREIVAGLTVFGAMAYIMAVNPTILSATGLARHDMVMTTIAGAVAGTLIMALWAKLPIALAPAMSSNVLFTQVIIVQGHFSPRTAFTVVFCSGLCFTALALTQLRQKIINGFPPAIIIGVQAAIGAFVARLGLITAGIAVPSPGGLAFGSLSDPSVILALSGIALCAAFLICKIPAGFLITIFVLTITGLFVPNGHGGVITQLPNRFFDWPHYPTHLLFPFDFKEFFSHLGLLIPITLYLLLSDFFDATATLMSVVQRSNLHENTGKLKLDSSAFAADGLASVVGATLGTSTVSAYVENLAGAEAGARTGLAAIVVALLFALSCVLWPLITAIPALAISPILVLVGLSMTSCLGRLSSSLDEALAPLFMFLIAAVTGNFMLSLTCGMLLYSGLAVVSRQFSRLTPVVLSLDIVFIGYMVLQTYF
ncbi:NCS2 family permease [Aristophania vespae]|uniref:NCS2 family permease n=1 Tax=Aristophania vespae TaxID=2697033 RepID=A0A6P1NJE9_9PROT|nr:NCS2 family permease [Aristophania vespae]QHI95802.1 NCS2 family permease [Aristophania vespae]UMM63508.1 Guanine/hypoxanthine permease PbuO [Aristophania vespae]